MVEPHEIDKRSPNRRIADHLRALIQSGELGPGDQVPSERELASTFSTARNTARDAIAILQAEGLVVARHGKGVFVRQQRPLMRLGSNRYSRRARIDSGMSPFRIEVVKQGQTPSTECRSVTVDAAPQDVAERLGLNAAGAEVVRRENWYFADDEPMQVGVTYIPAPIVAGSPLATEKTLGPGSIYARFEDLGYQIVRSRDEVSARMPTPVEAAALSMPPGVPVIEVLHTSFDAALEPFEVTRFVMRADLNGLDYNMPIED